MERDASAELRYYGANWMLMIASECFRASYLDFANRYVAIDWPTLGAWKVERTSLGWALMAARSVVTRSRSDSWRTHRD
jgi:hypothetical protein